MKKKNDMCGSERHIIHICMCFRYLSIVSSLIFWAYRKPGDQQRWKNASERMRKGDWKRQEDKIKIRHTFYLCVSISNICVIYSQTYDVRMLHISKLNVCLYNLQPKTVARLYTQPLKLFFRFGGDPWVLIYIAASGNTENRQKLKQFKRFWTHEWEAFAFAVAAAAIMLTQTIHVSMRHNEAFALAVHISTIPSFNWIQFKYKMVCYVVHVVYTQWIRGIEYAK